MTEPELVKQVLNGNEGACRFLVANYQRLVFHIVRRILSQNEDVEDICQEVFMKVFSQLKHFRGASKLSTWIASVAYHTSLTHYERQKRRTKSAVNYEFVPDIHHAPGVGEKGYEAEEMKKHLKRLIETLPVHYRTVLTLFYLEEFSYHEIGEITGMPEGTVKSYLSRARALLKCKLEKMQKNEKSAIFEQH